MIDIWQALLLALILKIVGLGLLGPLQWAAWAAASACFIFSARDFASASAAASAAAGPARRKTNLVSAVSTRKLE